MSTDKTERETQRNQQTKRWTRTKHEGKNSKWRKDEGNKEQIQRKKKLNEDNEGNEVGYSK
jgi:ribosomal protein L32E